MTDLKFALLHRIYSAAPTSPLSKYDLLNSNPKAINRTQEALDDLIYQEYISIPLGSTTVKITSAGRIAYETAKEEREKQAQNKRQQRFNNKISVASVLIPCITFILGIVIGHFSGIIEWIVSLFP